MELDLVDAELINMFQWMVFWMVFYRLRYLLPSFGTPENMVTTREKVGTNTNTRGGTNIQVE